MCDGKSLAICHFALISEPKSPSFCGISGDLAPSTRKSLAIAIVRFWCAKWWPLLSVGRRFAQVAALPKSKRSSEASKAVKGGGPGGVSNGWVSRPICQEAAQCPPKGCSRKMPPSSSSFTGRYKGGFVKGWFWRTYPRSGFRSGGTSERTLVPVFVPGEHPNVPSFWFSFRGNIQEKFFQVKSNKFLELPRNFVFMTISGSHPCCIDYGTFFVKVPKAMS